MCHQSKNLLAFSEIGREKNYFEIWILILAFQLTFYGAKLLTWTSNPFIGVAQSKFVGLLIFRGNLLEEGEVSSDLILSRNNPIILDDDKKDLKFLVLEAITFKIKILINFSSISFPYLVKTIWTFFHKKWH